MPSKKTSKRSPAKRRAPASSAPAKANTKKAGKKAGTIAKKSERKSASSARSAVRELSDDERKRLIKVPTGYEEHVERAIELFRTHRRVVAVPDLSPAQMASMFRRATRAWEKEDAVRTAYETKLRPLVDARMLAEHELWRSVLDLLAEARTAGRRRPEVARDFEFLSEFVGGRSRNESTPKPAPVEPEPEREPEET